MAKLEKELKQDRLRCLCGYLRNLKTSITVIRSSFAKLDYENSDLVLSLSECEIFITDKLTKKQNELMRVSREGN